MGAGEQNTICINKRVHSCPPEETYNAFETTAKNTGDIAIRVHEQDVYLLEEKGQGYKIYARKVRLDNGEWRIVQALFLQGNYFPFAIKVFNGAGKKLAYSDRETSLGKFIVKDRDEINILKGALKAVTGQDFEVILWTDTFM